MDNERDDGLGGCRAIIILMGLGLLLGALVIAIIILKS